MRYILAVFVYLFLNSAQIFGQGYYHSPNDTLIAVTSLDQQVTLNITQIHTSNDTLQFVWEKLNVTMPIEWEATICDNSNCYLSLVDAGTTLPVLPGDDGLLLIHCTPHTVMSVGIIQYTMYEISSPNDIDTLTWIINASGLSVITNSKQKEYFVVSKNQLVWMGNPFTNATISIISMTGQQIEETSLNSSEPLNLNLQNGNYWILMKTDSNFYNQKITIQHEN